jgi:hypothetical protein
MAMVMATATAMATAGMIMGPGGLTVGATGMTTIGMTVGPGGLMAGATVLVGILATALMSLQGMATLIQTSASPQATAGIRAPTIIMAIKLSARL